MSVLKEGFPFIFIAFAVGLCLFAVSYFVHITPVTFSCIAAGSLFIIFALFCVFFFRDPKISITQGDDLILSPCNGTVMELIEESDEKIVRVFLSIFSVHLQRAPVAGTVIDVKHKNGKFFAAWNPRAELENEQNIITIQAADGVYVVRQIAGFLARRCVSWVKPGDILKAGDKIGMIKFSSQVDLHIPKTAEIQSKPGDKTHAGITVMGQTGKK
jgi:phosphatidylserine decarboxylase